MTNIIYIVKLDDLLCNYERLKLLDCLILTSMDFEDLQNTYKTYKIQSHQIKHGDYYTTSNFILHKS